MPITISNALKNTRLQAVDTYISAGTNPSILIIYSGPQPAAGAPITTQLNLAQTNLPDPLAASIVNGVLTVASIPLYLISQDGIAVWWRILTDLGVWVMDGNTGSTGSGASMEVSNTNFITGSTVDITSFTFAE